MFNLNLSCVVKPHLHFTINYGTVSNGDNLDTVRRMARCASRRLPAGIEIVGGIPHFYKCCPGEQSGAALAFNAIPLILSAGETGAVCYAAQY
jgi:hypothetical protein